MESWRGHQVFSQHHLATWEYNSSLEGHLRGQIIIYNDMRGFQEANEEYETQGVIQKPVSSDLLSADPLNLTFSMDDA